MNNIQELEKRFNGNRYLVVRHLIEQGEKEDALEYFELYNRNGVERVNKLKQQVALLTGLIYTNKPNSIVYKEDKGIFGEVCDWFF